MSKAMSLCLGTGKQRGAVGVKTAKLGVKQDQIGKPFGNKGFFGQTKKFAQENKSCSLEVFGLDRLSV